MTLVQSGHPGNSRQDENWTKQLDGVAAKLHMQDLQTLWPRWVDSIPKITSPLGIPGIFGYNWYGHIYINIYIYLYAIYIYVYILYILIICHYIYILYYLIPGCVWQCHWLYANQKRWNNKLLLEIGYSPRKLTWNLKMMVRYVRPAIDSVSYHVALQNRTDKITK